MKTAHLSNRSILKITGPDGVQLLQGTTTQQIKAEEGQALYTAHLSPQGKFLFDFFVYPQQDESLWIDCAKEELMDLAKALHAYAVGLNVEFEDLSETHAIYAQWEKGPPAPQAIEDPRHPALGHRLVSRENVPTNATLAEYNAHRIYLGIPDGAVDAIKNKTLPAELGLEFLNGVSFSKGCYVGQEVTTRMHHRTKPKKRLYKITLQQPGPLAIGTPIVSEAAEAGFMLSNNGKEGLAIIREKFAAQPLAAAGNVCRATLPSYWPN